jgi:hypothetical protein
MSPVHPPPSLLNLLVDGLAQSLASAKELVTKLAAKLMEGDTISKYIGDMVR